MSYFTRFGQIRSYRHYGRCFLNGSSGSVPSRSSAKLQLQSRMLKLPTTRASPRRRKRNMLSTAAEQNGKRQSTTMATNRVESVVGNSRTNTFTFGELYRNGKTFLEAVLSKPRTIPIPRWVSPRHYQFTASEAMGHASFVLVAASYAVDDFLLLRIIAVAGSTSMLFFTYFHPHGRVLWLPFKWNALFIAINAHRIGFIYWNRYLAERLPEELMAIRRKTFFSMDSIDFYRLVRIAEIREYKKGDLVVAQGERVGYVRMVVKGQLRALRNGKLNYFLEEGNFISEVGIHAGLLLPGQIESCCTIVADGDGKGGDITRVLCWNRSELVHVMELYQGVRRSLKAVLSWDIVRKLKYQRLLLVEHLIDDPEEWTARRNEQTNHRYEAILQAVLRSPQNLQRFRKEVNKYREIHHIDDEHHATALASCGWTVEEFEDGKKQKKARKTLTFENGYQDKDDEDDDVLIEERRDWKGLMQDFYLRVFG